MQFFHKTDRCIKYCKNGNFRLDSRCQKHSLKVLTSKGLTLTSKQPLKFTGA